MAMLYLCLLWFSFQTGIWMICGQQPAVGPIQEKLYTYPPPEAGDMLLPNHSPKWEADSWLCDETQDLGTSHPRKNKVYANKTVRCSCIYRETQKQNSMVKHPPSPNNLPQIKFSLHSQLFT